ncbi:MAG: HEAT repeat domain-containing protein [Candidatus Aminicenantes bacterium]|nr:MAG: HEAT repeat domain-containing protein [Candidatus Aminicenantes bacterium]
MEQEKSDNKGSQEQPEASAAPEKPAPKKKINADELNRVNLLFKYFDTAFSTMKLYPPGNPSIKKSVDIFTEKLKEFLREFEELRIGIGEFSFFYKGEKVFQDEEKMRSLPFFLFKDGMRELSFYRGLERKELKYFLDVLKEAIDLPPEESDAIGLLWEKDFVNIRYYALDEFLDLNIGGGEKALDLDVDTRKFKEGKMDLKPEDMEEFKEQSDMMAFGQQKEEEGEGSGDLEGALAPASKIPALKPEEAPEIEALLSKSREFSASGELVDLLFEILFYEEDDGKFSDVLGIVEKYFDEIERKAEFAQVLTVLKDIRELKEIHSDKSKEKLMLLEKVEKNAMDEGSMARLKKLYLDEKVKDYDSFFQYLEFLEADATSVVGMIWENPKDLVHKGKASVLLKEIGKENIAALLYFAKGSNVALTKEIISMMETVSDLKEVHRLEEFVEHPNKEIRLEIIRVLGMAGNVEANKILVKFLSDVDVEVRVYAAKKLKYLGDKDTFEFIMSLAQDKGFRKRAKQEKSPLLKYLASAQTEEVYDLFRSFLKTWSLFSAGSHNETRFAVVSALEAQATPKVKEVLEEGTRVFGRSVRDACKSALSKMT